MSQITRLAAIDLGSNSFHLRIADASPSPEYHYDFQTLTRSKHMVQLARGLRSEGTLDEAAQQRATSCLLQFRQQMDKYQPTLALAIGTEALRRADQADRLIGQWQTILKCPVNIISAEEEARLTFAGLAHRQPVSASKDAFTTIDIGGSSTELCIGTTNQLQHWHSFRLGCIQLGERFFQHQHKLSPRQFDNALLYCQEQLASAIVPFLQASPRRCVGAAGTMKVIADLISGRQNSTAVKRTALIQLIEDTVACGELPESLGDNLRWDVIPAGIVLLLALMNALKIDVLELSNHGIKEGVMLGLLQNGT